MKGIVYVDLLSETDGNAFHAKLLKNVNERQKQGFIVEIQFSTSYDNDILVYSVLIISKLNESE